MAHVWASVRAYYDRLLSFRLQRMSWHRPVLIGLAYRCQELPHIERRAHDVPLDAVVTEEGMMFFQTPVAANPDEALAAEERAGHLRHRRPGGGAKKTTCWDGVRNYQARNFIRDQIGRAMPPSFTTRAASSRVLSASCASRAALMRMRARSIVMIRTTTQPASASSRAGSASTLRFYAGYPHDHARDSCELIATTELAGLMLLRAGNRLSITPVEEAHWRFIFPLE